MAHLNTASSSVSYAPSKCKSNNMFFHNQEMDEHTRKHLGNQSDRIKRLYPTVNESETPLPRQWGSKKSEKYSTLGLTHNDLRVFYKGSGKDHNDAASIRTAHPIPSSCGIYYFEVKVISKGRDGYMGIGLTAVQKMENRLPGWDKNSYGYHGDDGNSFCSSGIGQSYGPTFTTGDVIGCCMNFVDNTCFYTKNGVNLGIAFRDLPCTLYPTIGLQTPGEVVEANFGQSPFHFDFEDYLKEWYQKVMSRIENFTGSGKVNFTLDLPRLVASYLIHQGYSSTAEVFAQSSGQKLEEDLLTIRNRQRIQQMVLTGRISEAINLTQSLYPGLLTKESDLFFQLKCRQFIEMVNGADDDISPFAQQHVSSPKLSACGVKSSSSSPSSNGIIANNNSTNSHENDSCTNLSSSSFGPSSSMNGHTDEEVEMDTSESLPANNEEEEFGESLSNGDAVVSSSSFLRSNNHNNPAGNHPSPETRHPLREKNHFGNRCTHGEDHTSSPPHPASVASKSDRTHAKEKKSVSIERILRFGRDLHLMGEQLKKEKGRNEENEKVLKDAFSLLAYADPWNSPVGYQLDPMQRESISKALNRAILEETGLSKLSTLEVAISQASLCLKLMARAGIGSCAFASLSSIVS